MRHFFALLIFSSILLSLFSVQMSLTQAASPTLTPTPNMPNIVIELDITENSLPTYRIPQGEPQTSLIPALVYLPEPAHQSYPTRHQTDRKSRRSSDAEFADNWELLFSDDFEGGFPKSGCTVFDTSADGFERFWDDDNFKARNGSWAGWPAKGGADGLDPAMSDYPANMQSWLRCGPFDLSQAEKILLRFDRWLEIQDPDDSFYVGFSGDGITYSGLRTTGTQDWVHYILHVNGLAGDDTAWVIWGFESDADNNRAQGVWLDDLALWQYTTPEHTCGDLDPGKKGMTLPEYDPSAPIQAPIIRDGDLTALTHLIESDVAWVRWVFNEENGAVDVQMYDRMVDTLCAHNISVLGILNHQTLARQDFNEVSQAVSYRNEFTQTAAFLANYYRERVSHWEIWNEPDYNPSNDPQNPLPPFMFPQLYAPLLEATYSAIKMVTPEATIFYGGQSTALDGSFNYFQTVYNLFNDPSNPPFDYFTNHPYPDSSQAGVPADKKSLNPNDYLIFEFPTLLTKFTDEMNDGGAGGKRIWITEIGWNSAKGEANLSCQDTKVVSAQEQADYLTDSFHILFNQAVLADGQTKAVEKVIWYQYMDVAIAEEVVCPAGAVSTGKGFIATGYIPPEYKQPKANSIIVPWWFGIYNGNKTAPKLSQCAFAAYPFGCGQELEHIYLPTILR